MARFGTFAHTGDACDRWIRRLSGRGALRFPRTWGIHRTRTGEAATELGQFGPYGAQFGGEFVGLTFRAFGASTSIRPGLDENGLALLADPVGRVDTPVGVSVDAGDLGVGTVPQPHQIGVEPVGLRPGRCRGALQGIGPRQRGVPGGMGGRGHLRRVLPGLGKRGHGLVTGRPDDGVGILAGLADLLCRLPACRGYVGVSVPPGRLGCGHGLGSGGFEHRLCVSPGRGLGVPLRVQAGKPFVELVNGGDRFGRDSLRLDPRAVGAVGGLFGADRTGDRFGDPLGGFRLDRLDMCLGGGHIAEVRHLADETVQGPGEAGGKRRDLLGQRVSPCACTGGTLRPDRSSGHRVAGLHGQLTPPAVGRQPVVRGIIAVRRWPARSGWCARWMHTSWIRTRHRLGLVVRRALDHANKDARVSETAERAATTVALFDLDGVLVRGDTFTRLLRRHLSGSLSRTVLVVPVLPLTAIPVLRPTATRLIMRLALIGWDPARFRAQAEAFGRELAADHGVAIPEAVAAARSHGGSGGRVVVVTACEHDLARAVLDALGLADVELVASRLGWGRFGVGRGSLHNYGREKPRQLAAYGVLPPWDHAYGDSPADLPMLAGARRAVLVNPDQDLVIRARRELGSRLEIVRW